MSIPHDHAADHALVLCALAGDPDAWQTLYHQEHGKLLWLLFTLIGPNPNRDDLAEEYAARVWCKLLDRDAHWLRAYDPARGSATTFLGCLARQLLRDLPKARNARLTYAALGNGQAVDGGVPWPRSLVLAEFRATLSPQEGRYFEEHLLGNPTLAALPPLTLVNCRQLKTRVFRRLNAFLYGD